MSGSTPRPSSYGWVDQNKNNQYTAPEIPQAGNGWENGAFPTAKEFNTVNNRHAAWASYLDSHAVRSEHLMGPAALSRLSSSIFAFNFGPGLSKTVAADSCFVVNGVIVDLPISRLEALGYSPFVFTASRWTHWYIDKDGVSFAIVAIGVAAVPPAGSYHLGTVVTNATNVTNWTTGAGIITEQILTIASELVQFGGTIKVGGDGVFESSASVSGSLTVDGATQANGSLTVVGALSANSGVFSGPFSVTGAKVSFVNTSSVRRACKYQNSANGAVGFLLQDTITYVGQTDLIALEVLPASELPNSSQGSFDMTVAMGQADLTKYGCARYFGRWVKSAAGVMTVTDGASALSGQSFNSGAGMTPGTVGPTAGTLRVSNSISAIPTNIEISYRVQVLTF